MGAFGGATAPIPFDAISDGVDYAKVIDRWVNTNTNGTLAAYAGAGGGITMTLGGADNDQGMLALDYGAIVDVTAAGPKFWMEGVIHVTEANASNRADWFFGVSTGLTTDDGIFSDTAATLATQDAIGIYKTAATNNFKTLCVSTSTSNAGATSTTTYADETRYRLRVEIEANTGGITARMYVNGAQIGSTIENFSYTGMNVMHIGMCIKATNTDAEVLRCESFSFGLGSKLAS